jgi:glucose-6-phosphate isomerase
MDEHRVTRAENVYPGSLHYISGNIAHRLANTGNVPLTIGACWYSDAGHNYGEIERNGFSARLLDVEGIPTLVESGI